MNGEMIEPCVKIINDPRINKAIITGIIQYFLDLKMNLNNWIIVSNIRIDF